MAKLNMRCSMNYTRLEELRDELGFTKKEMAKELGISDSMYGRWENDRTIIPTRRLYQLGNYFQVNIDYLLKFSDLRQQIVSPDQLDSIKVSARVREIRKELHYTLRELSANLNTSSSTWSAYETGKVLILSAFLLQICQEGNFSIDWVLGRSEVKYRNK